MYDIAAQHVVSGAMEGVNGKYIVFFGYLYLFLSLFNFVQTEMPIIFLKGIMPLCSALLFVCSVQ